MNKNLEYYLNLNYPFEIKKDNDGTYFIRYPDLKGCMSCADTIENVLMMGEDARKCWIETALEDNVCIPEPNSLEEDYSGNFRIRMPKSLHKEIAEESKTEGISMNQYCIYLLSKYHTKKVELTKKVKLKQNEEKIYI